MSAFFHRCGKMAVCGTQGIIVGGLFGGVICVKNYNPNLVIIKTCAVAGGCIGIIYGYYYEPEDFNAKCGEAMDHAFGQEQRVPKPVPTGNPVHRYDPTTGRYVATNLPQQTIVMVPI